MPFQRDTDYVNRIGETVRIVCNDCPGPAPLIGYWFNLKLDRPVVSQYTADGEWWAADGFRLYMLDLVEPKPAEEGCCGTQSEHE